MKRAFHDNRHSIPQGNQTEEQMQNGSFTESTGMVQLIFSDLWAIMSGRPKGRNLKKKR